MDYRKALPPQTLLDFPGMPCTLSGEVGRGSNAIVYLGTYPDLFSRGERHTVLVKELFPLHLGGAVFRDVCGEIICAPEGRETWELHRQSFAHGNRLHLRMLENHPERTGANLNTFSLRGTMYTVLGYAGGRSLEAESIGPATDLRRLTVLMLGLLDALEAFHESGFLHLDIAPDNVLLIGRGDREQVMLIDYNSVYDCGACGRDAPVCSSVKSGYSAPELRTAQSPSTASDLYAVAAVFFRCLTGAALTPFQMSRPAPPDVSGCPCLQTHPDTVAVMVRQILRRGLQVLPKKRYPSADAMREAFQELLDRVDGVGVTHWALWESGRRIVERVIRENPGLAFLKDRESLFPARLLLPGGAIVPADIPQLLRGEDRAVLLASSGGTGKTTAMLRGVIEQSRSYAPVQPAMIYISLYDWREGESAYIHRRLLENLRFKTEQYDAALHALDTLLDKPLETRSGESRPVAVLLLDGLNEVSGDASPLIGEILSLSCMQGVRLVVSTRSEEPALPFPRAELALLTEGDVDACVRRAGLLLPESPEMRELLRTPLMLSIFLRSSRAGCRQLSVSTREELMNAYFSALLDKELKALPGGADARWQIDAAMSFVLPVIAREVEKRGRALEDAALLPAVEGCYRLFSDRLLRRAFPRWIGRSQAIRGGAANAEEWYGQIVHELLWKRLGLLVRNEQGRYRVCHQIVAEYLTAVESENARRLIRRRRLRRVLAAGALLCCLAAGWYAYAACIRPPAYSEAYEEDVFVYGLCGYAGAARQYAHMRSLVDCALEDPEHYRSAEKTFSAAIRQEGFAYNQDYALDMLERMLPTGKVISWSRRELDGENYRKLLQLEPDRREEYEFLATVLTYVMEDERGNRLYGAEYLAGLSELVEIDADITATLYEIVCVPHLTKSILAESENLRAFQQTLEVSAAQMNRHISEETDPDVLGRRLLRLQGMRDDIRNGGQIGGAIAAYEDSAC